MFAFSTCWNSDGHTDGEPVLDEIRALGFSNIELSHGIRLTLIEGIERVMKKDPSLRITSLHNFCPLPVGYFRSAPNIYLFSSKDEVERQRAVRQTILTLDFAVRMRARCVVLHLGSVPMPDYTADLLALVHAGQRETPRYQKLLQKAIAKRESRGRDAFSRSMKSLEAMARAASERKIVLGIESRYRLEEIPSEKEFAEIFRVFDKEQIGYWHDTGHTHTWHNLGLADHVRWLDRFKGRLVGSHVHDLAYPDHDHQVPGHGEVPFDQLTPLRVPDVLKVFEFSPGMPAATLSKHLPPFMRDFERSAA
ncbi:MAG: sugar phosphate isomerase/epimerase [Verrucomicrobia bacterium]|nr:sugar phosphate isomerase/epimerase [Verrucomicrobiota bacterium]